MRVHIIKDGKVDNTIEIESIALAQEIFPDAECRDADEGGVKGDYWDGLGYTTPTEAPAGVVKAMVDKLEATVIAVIQKPITLAREYEQRESQAQAFKDAGYTGEPGKFLKDFADEAALDYESAADRVLSQAVNFRTAEPILAGVRMKKYAIQRAPDVDAAKAIFDEAMQQIVEIVAMIG